MSDEMDEIDLDSLAELSDEIANASAYTEIDYLSFDSLTELSDAAAESLSKNQGDLGLSVLTELSDTAAKSLAKIDPNNIYLSGEIEAQVAKYR